MPKLIDADSLFRATLDVFAANGYLGLTTQEVARRAGINEATIYRRYGTKAGLVQAALTQGLSTSPFAHLTISGDTETDLLAMVEAFRDTTRLYGGAVVTLLTEASHHPELRAAMAPLLVNMSRATDVLQTHQQNGELIPGSPWQQLLLLLSPLLAIGLWARTGVAPPAEPTSSELVAAFLDGQRTH